MLCLPELIAGVQVEPLTPRRLEWLRAMGNPFVCGGDCPIAAIPDFLWYVTKDFAFGDDERRKAFLAALADPELLAEAQKMRIEITPTSGEDVEKLIARLYATPKDVVEKVRTTLGR